MSSDKTPTKVQEALDELLELPPPDGQVDVCLATKTDRGLDYYRLPLKKAPAPDRTDHGDGKAKKSASRRFAEVLEGGVERARKLQKSGALPPCEHSSTVVPLQGQIEYIDLRSTGAGHLGGLLAPLLKGPALPNFAKQPNILDALRFYTIHDRRRALRSFRILSPKVQLSRSPWFAIVSTGMGGAYDLADDNTFLFDDAVDCLLLHDRWLFILHRTQFQQMFSYFDVLEESKDLVLQGLASRGLIDDFERLKQDSTGIAMTTKLAGMEASPVLAEGGPPEDYWQRARFVIDLFGLKVRIVGKPGSERFVYDPVYRWQLMHLLNDDYLVSPQAPQPTLRGARALHKRPETLTFPVMVEMPAASAAALIPSASAVASEALPSERKGPRKAPSRAGERKGRRPA